MMTTSPQREDHTPRSARAFTLIEILIVVAIISILATIAIMRVRDLQSDAETAAVRDQLRELRLQIKYYHFIENIYPDSLGTLATSGYVSHDPAHPGPGNFVYDNTNGQLVSSVDNTW
ncbi:MAG: type II secretion system protein [Planctomycetota bacterium]